MRTHPHSELHEDPAHIQIHQTRNDLIQRCLDIYQQLINQTSIDIMQVLNCSVLNMYFDLAEHFAYCIGKTCANVQCKICNNQDICKKFCSQLLTIF